MTTTNVVKFNRDGASIFNRAKPLTNVDGWANVLTGLGLRARDKRNGAVFLREYELDRNTLENLYHGDDIVARICELPAKEATREWIEIHGDKDRKIQKKLQALNAREKIYEALVWSRLYGASILVMIVDDGQALDQPLDPSKVTDILDLMVIDRWDLWITKFYSDASKPDFGMPEIYSIRTSAIVIPGQGLSDSGYGTAIHESRVLRFEGTITGRRRRRDNQGWALSVLDRMYEVCRDFTAAYGGMANLLQDYSQAVFKIKGLANSLASDQDNVILKRLQLLDLSRSIARAIPLDADGEDFDRKATPTAGLPDLLDRMASRLSAATDIPITLLMGTSAKGLNATGEGDLENWYNNVRNFQETRLRNPISILLKVIAKATGTVLETPDGQDQEEIEFSFRPLWQPTEKEIAETRKTVAESDTIYYDMGVLDNAEIAISRFGGERYSIETSLDLAAHTQQTTTNTDPNALDPAGVRTAAKTDIQQTVLNGIQINALQAILQSVGTASMTPETAKIMIKLSFPAFDQSEIDKMVNAQEVKKPEPVPAPGANPNNPAGAKQTPGKPETPTGG